MGTGTIFIKLMKVEDVQFFNKSMIEIAVILFFVLQQPLELRNILFFPFFRVLDSESPMQMHLTSLSQPLLTIKVFRYIYLTGIDTLHLLY